MIWFAGGTITLFFVWWIFEIIRQYARQYAREEIRRKIAENDILRMIEAAKGIYRANEASERRLRAVHGDPTDTDISRMFSGAPGDPEAPPPSGT